MFTMVTWVGVVYTVDSTCWPTIKGFVSSMVTKTTAASKFSTTLRRGLKVLLTICVLVFAVTARVVIVLCGFVNRLFFIIRWRLP